MAAPIQERKSMIKEFKEFISTGDLVTIAIGLVMALYTFKIIDAILNGVINPIIAAIFGETSFQNIGFDVGDARISIGLVIDAIISFVVVGFILFLIVKAYNKFRAAQPPPPPSDEVVLLTEIRDALRQRG